MSVDRAARERSLAGASPYSPDEVCRMAADGGRHPLADGCPPAWASAWGQDQFGIFVEFRIGDIDQRMRWIRPGIFRMGSPDDEPGRWNDEGPQHLVVIGRGFWLGETPVTQGLWQAVAGENPSRFQGDNRPVEQVSWVDCQRFCAQLSERLPGPAFRLPTEAEWEYACRAGTSDAAYADALHLRLDDIAWYSKNGGGQTHAVRNKSPNPWGLYDTLGNVWEWCSDYAFRRYGSSSDIAIDPIGPAAGGDRVIRGGSWVVDARGLRAAGRGANPPGDRDAYLGLRLVRDQHQ